MDAFGETPRAAKLARESNKVIEVISADAARLSKENARLSKENAEILAAVAKLSKENAELLQHQVGFSNDVMKEFRELKDTIKKFVSDFHKHMHTSGNVS